MVSRLPGENELVPYDAGFPPGKRWLVLAPHPDDETFGAGATMAQATLRGVELAVVCLTSGGAQGTAREREEEAAQAAKALGVAPPEFWRLPDRSLAALGPLLVERLRTALDRAGTELILTPSPVELHPDHRAVALAVHRTVQHRLAWGLRRRTPRWVAAYEVGSPLLPNVLVPGEEAWDRKRRAMACYSSQSAFKPYAAIMDGLGLYRSLTLPRAERAEAFFVLESSRLARMGPRRWAGLMGASRTLG